MWMRLFVYLIILISIVVAVLALSLNHDPLVKLIYFRDFFDVALPILAFGALVKYLCTSITKCKTCNCHK